MHRYRVLAAASICALAAAAASFAFARPRAAAVAAAGAGAPCSQQTYRSPDGVVFNILFAKNGAVQRYVLVHSYNNVERDNAVRTQLEARYGPEGIDAPPIRIVSFSRGSNGMSIPDKAIDSCGRTIAFN